MGWIKEAKKFLLEEEKKETQKMVTNINVNMNFPTEEEIKRRRKKWLKKLKGG